MRRHADRRHPGPTLLLPVDDDLFWPHPVAGPLTEFAATVLAVVEAQRGPAAATVKERIWRTPARLGISARA